MRVPAALAAALLALVAMPSCSSPIDPGWRSATPLPKARFEAFAVNAGDRIYYLGGIIGTGTDPNLADPTPEVDVIDRANGAWRLGLPLPKDAPKHHLAVAVLDGEIYVLGGFDGIIGKVGDDFRPSGVVYALRSTGWARLANQPIARGAATAQAMGGKIYVTGGSPNEGQPSFAQLFIYDPKTNLWSRGRDLPTPREHLASCVVGGKMLVVGGWSGADKKSSAAAEFYDPVTDLWTRVADLPTARGGLGAVAHGGQCWVLGGEDWALPYPGTFGDVDVFDPLTGAWTKQTPFFPSRHGIGVAELSGEIWVVGGGPGQGNSYTPAVDVLHP